jgi:hypothetical protein
MLYSGKNLARINRIYEKLPAIILHNFLEIGCKATRPDGNFCQPIRLLNSLLCGTVMRNPIQIKIEENMALSQFSKIRL